MPRINLPPGCAGISDGDWNWRRWADKPGGHITLDETDPVEKRQLQKLRNQDYASAGLVDAGPEKFFAVRKDDGKWCKPCRRVWNRWSHVCPRCGEDTVPEAEMPRDLPAGPYMP